MPARIFPTRSTIGRRATCRRTSPIRRRPLGTPVPPPARRVCMPEIVNLPTHRRGFLGRIAAGAAALGLGGLVAPLRSEEHTSELQSQSNFVCRLLLEKKNDENSYRVLYVHHSQ